MKLDLFEKRFAVYKATKTFLYHTLAEGSIGMDEFWGFSTGVQDAMFLFRSDVVEYLDAIETTVLGLSGSILAPDKRVALVNRQQTELRNGAARLDVVFGSYLKFAKWK